MNTMQQDWYRIQNVDELDSPALVVYPERVKANIKVMLGMVDDPARLRPHVKTHKSAEVTKLMMQAGVNKFKCATIAEAEMLGMCQAKDVLFAYQPVGPKLKRFVRVIKKYPVTKFSCLTDHRLAAKEMSDAFESSQLKVPVFLDLNVGQNRTGIVPGPDAISLYNECAKLGGIEPIGLHAYDGHIRDADFDKRKQNCDACFELVENLKKEIVQRGFRDPVIVAGGSPTFSIHSRRKIIECSPGTFIYWDKGYLDLCPEQEFQPAAVLVSRVISLPGPGRICLDLGHKSVAAENDITRRVYFLNAPGFKAISQSEEHLVVEAEANHSFTPGDVLYGLPIHICPTVALYERTYTIEAGKVTGEWRTIARDRKIEC